MMNAMSWWALDHVHTGVAGSAPSNAVRSRWADSSANAITPSSEAGRSGGHSSGGAWRCSPAIVAQKRWTSPTCHARSMGFHAGQAAIVVAGSAALTASRSAGASRRSASRY
jgi:hypothetical protein